MNSGRTDRDDSVKNHREAILGIDEDAVDTL